MKINRVTITGADDYTSLLDLSNLSAVCPFVEWGILFSKSKEGTERYPSASKIEYFSALGLQLSAHFCGWYSKEVLEKRNYSILEKLDGFARVQINYNFQNSTGWDLRPFIDWIIKHPAISIIFQANKANAHTIGFLEGMDTPQNIHFLYDSSGGRGSVISEIKKPFGNYTGYSGGIGPNNITSVVKKINEYPNTQQVWVDMETGVRTDNKLDIQKVCDVLQVINDDNVLSPTTQPISPII